MAYFLATLYIVEARIARTWHPDV